MIPSFCLFLPPFHRWKVGGGGENRGAKTVGQCRSVGEPSRKQKGTQVKRKELKHPAPFVKPVLNSSPFVRGDKRRELSPPKKRSLFLLLSIPTPSRVPFKREKLFTMVSERACEADATIVPGRKTIYQGFIQSGRCQKQVCFIWTRAFFFLHVIIKTLNIIHRVWTDKINIQSK